MAKDTVLAMHKEAFQLRADGRTKEAEALSRHGYRSESETRLRAMISLASTEIDVALTPEHFDADPWAFNVLNGTLDLTTGHIRPHDPQDLITKLAPVKHDPNAEAPAFRSFLSEVLGGDESLMQFVQRAVGYALVGKVQEHALFFLYGSGANGKTTLLNVLLQLFGDYGLQAEPSLLIRKRGETHPTGVADLKGARLVTTSEIDAGQRMAEALVKQLTGGDRIKARFMRQNFFEFEPTHTLFMAANHRPVIKGADHAIWRRIYLIPFAVTIPEERRDPRLPEVLERELPGILNWALAGCLAWQQKGLAPPAVVVGATEDYRTDMDDLGVFLDENCVFDDRATAESRDLYARYLEWADENGGDSVARNVFGRQLQERGFESFKDSTTRRVVYRRIGLKQGFEGTRSNLHGAPEN